MKFYKILKNLLKLEFWLFLWNYWKGTMEMVSHHYEKAIIHLNYCLKLDSFFDKSGLVYEHLGKCYFGINEIEKSKFYLLKASEFIKDAKDLNSEVTSRLGFIFFQEGQTERAKYYLELAKTHYKKNDYTNIEAVKEYLSKISAM